MARRFNLGVHVESTLVVSNAASSATRLTERWRLLAYGSLALPLCLAEIPIVVYLPAFYAQELRLSAVVIGTIFLLARLWDGLSDILVGRFSDRTASRWGRRKPWVVFGAPFLMVSTWFLCNPPKSAGLVYLSVWAALFYTSFTAVKIPHLSWGTELATDYVERSRVTSFREAFTMLGYLFFATAPLAFHAQTTQLRTVLILISLTTLISVPITTTSAAIFVRDSPASRAALTPLFKEAIVLAKDRILSRFLLGRFVWAIEEGVVNSLLVFSFDVGLQLPDKMFWAIFVLYIATLVALPVALKLAHRVEKHHLLAAGVVAQATVYGAALFIPSGRFSWIVPLWIALGIANSATLSLPTSVLADIIDHGEAESGERHSGSYVALDNLIYKLGMALGVGISFGLLGVTHYDPAAAFHDATDIGNIRALGFGLPCVLSALAAVIYFTHPITRDLQRLTRERIEARSQTGSYEHRAEPPTESSSGAGLSFPCKDL